MPDISSVGPDSLGPLSRASGSPYNQNGAAPTQPGEDRRAPGVDRVELSPYARYLNLLRRLPDVRSERVEEIRQEILKGTYESEEKVSLAIERLMEELVE